MSIPDTANVYTPQNNSLLRKGLKLSHLRLLAALSETGQISAAATQLAMSQPAASRLLTEIEKIAGFQLYRRHARGIILTAYGDHLASSANRVLRELDSVGREMAEMGSGVLGAVTVGAVTGPALELVLPSLRQLRMTHPGIVITVVVDTSDRLAEGLLTERLDFAIGRIPQEIDQSRLRAHFIGPEPVSLIVRKDHPLTKVNNLKLENCVAYDWLQQAPGGLLRHAIETYILERGLPLPPRVIGTTSILMTLAMVTQTNAIAPISTAVAHFFGAPQGLDGRIETLAVADDMTVPPYSILTRNDRRLSPASQVLYDSILRQSESLKKR